MTVTDLDARGRFVSQQPARSAALRQRYQRAALTPDEFVDEVLAPFRVAPVPAPGLLKPGADYSPSSQRMQPEIAQRFRGLAEDLVFRSTDDPEVRRRALRAVEALLARIDQDVFPGRPMRSLADSEVVEIYCELVRVVTGISDPYELVKRFYNEQALRHLPEIAQVAESVEEPALRTKVAINLGIIGNAIDFADPLQQVCLDNDGFDMTRALRQATQLEYVEGLDARASFLAALHDTDPGGAAILFLVDNAGEVVFDLPLVKLWLAEGWPVTLVGKSTPCYNDMTVGDLQVLLGDRRVREYLGSLPAVMASGTAMIGLDLRRAPPEFVAAWQRAAVVYAKGQGMVQTLRYAALSRDVFHAVQVKDPAYFYEGVLLKAGDALFLHSNWA